MHLGLIILLLEYFAFGYAQYAKLKKENWREEVCLKSIFFQYCYIS